MTRKYRKGDKVRYSPAAIAKLEARGFRVTREAGTVVRIARFSARLEQYAIRFDDTPDKLTWLYSSEITNAR